MRLVLKDLSPCALDETSVRHSYDFLAPGVFRFQYPCPQLKAVPLLAAGTDTWKHQTVGCISKALPSFCDLWLASLSKRDQSTVVCVPSRAADHCEHHQLREFRWPKQYNVLSLSSAPSANLETLEGLCGVFGETD